MVLATPPDAGRVNVRLSPPLPTAEAARVYKACLHDTLHAAARERGRIEVWYQDSGSGSEYFESWFPHLRRYPQATITMAERLVHALDRSFQDGARRMIALPGDAPVLPARALSAAFDDLHEVDVVLGPTGRTGWYLIGARTAAWTAARAIVKRLGSGAVSAEMFSRETARAGISGRLLPGGYGIRCMEDLRRARNDAPATSNLGRWLASRTAHRYVAT